MYMTACEKAEIQNATATIDTRTECVDECADCPVEDCCCSITLTEGTGANLTFCGVSDPCLSTMACYAEADACIISGYELYADISTSDRVELFCVRKNTPFYILSDNVVTARITCQQGYLNPQTVSITGTSKNPSHIYVM